MPHVCSDERHQLKFRTLPCLTRFLGGRGAGWAPNSNARDSGSCSAGVIGEDLVCGWVCHKRLLLSVNIGNC
eukprot:scaffold310393_cov14-Tisochrysis_lutea.AAC.1